MLRDSSDIVTRYSPKLLEDVLSSCCFSTMWESNEGSGGVGNRPWWSVGPREGRSVARSSRDNTFVKRQQVLSDIVRWLPRRQES